ncbi:hypothetical protein EP7_001660 [Isosphaeraceae bacterium EP7]
MDASATAAETGREAAFEALDDALKASGAAAVLDSLIATLTERAEFRPLLDAMLLRARHELDLPLVQPGSLADLPEPTRTHYEERYVESIRKVGKLMLDHGEIAAAWPYFRAISEPDQVVRAIEDYSPGTEIDERLGQVVEVAFNQGVSPRKGFELILKHYGTCSSISAFEGLPQDPAVRQHCAGKLVRQLHAHLVENLRGEITRRGQPLPPDGSPIPALIARREWLFAEDSYHIDVSHLSASVRYSPLLIDDAEGLALALELTEYGRNLSARHRFEGEPPFDDVFVDHAAYLGVLLGREVEKGLAHFRSKLVPADPDGRDDNAAVAQALVRLLVRLDRIDDAIDVAAEHLAGVPDSMLNCPSLAQLCHQAGRLDRLSRASRERDDLVQYAAAILQDERA